VLPKYAFIRPDEATPDAKDILVQSLVPELMGCVVRTGSCQRPRLKQFFPIRLFRRRMHRRAFITHVR